MKTYSALRGSAAVIALLAATLLTIIGAQSAILADVDHGTTPSTVSLQLPDLSGLGHDVGRLALRNLDAAPPPLLNRQRRLPATNPTAKSSTRNRTSIRVAGEASCSATDAPGIARVVPVRTHDVNPSPIGTTTGAIQ
ncbi:hypothetical protein [Antrihabitans spumae]|uniref:hypothetical protein n=1 Tax=Antrihabitans spumae TaxID=3373370 RepID=UPI0037516421